MTFSLKPRLHPEAAIEQVGGRWMVATPDDQLHFLVADGSDDPSDVGDRILDLSDGSRTIGEIAEVISLEFEVDREVALQDTAELVGQLLKCGVLVS